MRTLIACTTIFVIVVCSVSAATIERRDDLRERINSLRPMYQPYSENAEGAAGSINYAVFHLSGEIVSGDTAKLIAMEQQLWEQTDYYSWVLVLDSPGGNFLEGIKLGKELKANLSSHDPAFRGAYVLANNKCLSACSLIFALAATPRMLNENDSARFIETGGRVGFHMGAFPEKLAAQKVEVQKVMNLTYDIMAAYTEILRDKTSPVILVLEALKHRKHDSFFNVEADQRAYDLGFIPMTSGPLANTLYIHALPMTAVNAMCTSLLHSSSIETSIVTDDYGFISASRGENSTISEFIDTHGNYVFSTHFTSGEGCQFAVTPDQRLLISVTAEALQCQAGSLEGEDWCITNDPLNRFATAALLADAMGCQNGRLHHKFQYWSVDRTGDDWIHNEDWSRNTRAAVNMRAEPGLDTQIVGELVADSKVIVTDCRVTSDSQALWFKIRADNIEGWISARFIHGGNMGEFRALD